MYKVWWDAKEELENSRGKRSEKVFTEEALERNLGKMDDDTTELSQVGDSGGGHIE